jgi:uncharacterized protein (TIGR03435 family)
MRILFCLMLSSLMAIGQEQPTGNHFEFVSIKAGVPGGCGVRFLSLEFRLENCPLDYLIKYFQYGNIHYDMIGLPKWTSSAWYSITAKSVAPAIPREQWQMLGPVLKDRFGFQWHWEKRQKPVYFLTAAKTGVIFPVTGSGSCVTWDPKTGPVTPDLKYDRDDPMFISHLGCGIVLAARTPGGINFQVRGATMADLSASLTQYVDRPLLDSTGLTQKFDVSLKFSTTLTTGDNDLMFPSVAGALKSAGLIVTKGEAAVDVIVIDNIQTPSEN